MAENSKLHPDKTTYKFQGKGDHPNSDEATSVPNLTSSEDNPFPDAASGKSSTKTSSSRSTSSKKES